MHAIPPFFPIHGRPVPPSAAEIDREGGQLAEAVAKVVKGRRLGRVSTWITVGSPAACILRAARGADTIVMGTLGRTGLPHLLLGSVAERVVRYATIPVLTVRARRREGRALTGPRRAARTLSR
jgi:nucleotide-binding universal stress UspA family protein